MIIRLKRANISRWNIKHVTKYVFLKYELSLLFAMLSYSLENDILRSEVNISVILNPKSMERHYLASE